MQRIRSNLCLKGEVCACFLFSCVCQRLLHGDGVHTLCLPHHSLVWRHLEPGFHRSENTPENAISLGTITLHALIPHCSLLDASHWLYAVGEAETAAEEKPETGSAENLPKLETKLGLQSFPARGGFRVCLRIISGAR